jgi:hypothetical protein
MWGVGVERETGGERKTTKLGSAAAISTRPSHAHPFPEYGRSSHSTVALALPVQGHQMIRSPLWGERKCAWRQVRACKRSHRLLRQKNPGIRETFPHFFAQLVQGLRCMIANWAIRSSLAVEGFGPEIAASPFLFSSDTRQPTEPVTESR